MAREFRRIVTGHNAHGKSIIASDGPANQNFNEDGGGTAEFWTTDGAPADNKAAGDPALRPTKLEPPVNGTNFRYFALPPDSLYTREQLEAHASGLFKAIGATHCRIDTSRHPGMHRTKTVDYIILLEGEVSLLVDEGDPVPMKQYDVVIQRGTNHAWVNTGKTPALMVAVLIDAKPAP